MKNDFVEYPVRLGYEKVELLPAPFTLKEFQFNAVWQMIKFLNSSGGVYNAAEQGLGKSIMAIATMNALGLWDQTLIICPAVMRLVWKKEIEKFKIHKVMPQYKQDPIVFESGKEIKQWLESDDPYKHLGTFICSYELASSELAVKLFKSFKLQLLICDEAHYLKSRKTKRTKAILRDLAECIPKVIALSGTPITQCVTDLYTWANFFAPATFPNFYKFANRYAEQTHTPFGIKYHGIRHADELKNKIRSLFFIRYTKDEVMPELPPKQWIEVPLPESFAVKKLPDCTPTKTAQSMELALAAIENPNAPPVPQAVQTIVKSIRQAQGIHTIKPVAEFVRNLLEQDIPVVLFAHHTRVIEGLKNELSNFKTSVITGETSPKNRMQAVEDFQGGKTLLFIGQSIASGIGITLTRSSNVVFAELDYSPAVIAQCTDRCHRYGTKSSVNVYYFSIDGSLVSRIINVLVEKTKSFDKLLK